MTLDKDFKRLTRQRMSKTGESYTTARKHLLAKQGAGEGAGKTSPTIPESDGLELPANYQELAGMSDQKVAAATGHTWPQWVETLDEIGALQMNHTEIAAKVDQELGLYWWGQTVAVGYGRIRGLRVLGQQHDGTFQAGKSKTFRVPVAALYEAFAIEHQRQAWLDLDVEVTTATPHKSVRMREPNGRGIVAHFVDKGPERATVQVQVRKLSSADEVEVVKDEWRERLERLAGYLLD